MNSKMVTLSDGRDYEQIWDGHDWRILNLLPSDPAKMAMVYSGRDIMAPSDIHDFEDPIPNLKIKDQNGRGACVGHATARAVEFAREMQGLPYVPLSAWYIYAILCGGWDRGANILDSLAQVTKDGVAPESLVTYGTINPNSLTAEAHAAASRFKVVAGRQLTTMDQILTAVALRKSINLAVTAGNSFMNVDGEGVPGVSWGMTNHSVMVGGGIKTSSRWGKLIKMANSWTITYGVNGFCWLSEAHLFKAGFECYELDVVASDPLDILPGVI